MCFATLIASVNFKEMRDFISFILLLEYMDIQRGINRIVLNKYISTIIIDLFEMSC